MSRSEIDWDHVESVRKLKQSLHEKRQHRRNQELTEVSGSLKNESFRDYNNTTYGTASCDDFKYDSVTRNIYEKFGKEKQYCDYPQKIPPPVALNNSTSNTRYYSNAGGNKLPDLKRIKADRMRKIWENDHQTNQADDYDHRNHHHYRHHHNHQRHSIATGPTRSIQNNGADEKFLDKILTLKNYI